MYADLDSDKKKKQNNKLEQQTKKNKTKQLNEQTKQKKLEVHALLQEYRNVFSTHSRDFGRTNLVHHKIDLSDSDPPKQYYVHYTEAPKLREIVREKVDDLLFMIR